MADIQMNENKENTFNDCIRLLTDDIRHEGWEYNIGRMRSFYIRGATWLKNNILDNSKKTEEYLRDIEDPLKDRPEWKIPGFDWDKPFSSRQVIDVLSLKKRKSAQFFKSVQVFGLCEYICRQRAQNGGIDVNPDEIFERMRIQPAVFYIPDFDTKILETLKKERPTLLSDLGNETGQIASAVFSEMSKGYTVTKSLAEKTQSFLAQTFPDAGIRPVDFRYHQSFLGAAKSETLL